MIEKKQPGEDGMKRVLVMGAGGFIGGHLVRRLRAAGIWVRGVDLFEHSFSGVLANEFMSGDLRDVSVVKEVMTGIEEIYQLAADMGGAGYLFTGDHDATIMHNSLLINLNTLKCAVEAGVRRIFFTSSACVYPTYNQLDPQQPTCSEDSVYPALPDSEYGWEKLFSERLYLAYMRNHGLAVRIGRLHNVYGTEGAWHGGREKSPAAICRKIIEAQRDGEIEIWGDGNQTRSFLYVDDCIEGIRRVMASDYTGPFNIGSEEMITINDLALMIMNIADKQLSIRHTNGPQGVRGRTSDNRAIQDKLGWKPKISLHDGLLRTYTWIAQQITTDHSAGPAST